jgi:hypothetical protein
MLRWRSNFAALCSVSSPLMLTPEKEPASAASSGVFWKTNMT